MRIGRFTAALRKALPSVSVKIRSGIWKLLTLQVQGAVMPKVPQQISAKKSGERAPAPGLFVIFAQVSVTRCVLTRG